jgi:N-acetylglucosamine kinase-like BadF-type ATPase
MENIIVGVYGGDSKCKIIVKDEENQELCMLEKEDSANIAIDTELAWENIRTLYEDASYYIQKQYGININDQSEYQVHIGLGLASMGTQEDRKKFESLLNDSQLFASSKLKSDAYIAYFGAFNGEDGIIIISGTTNSIGLRYEDKKVTAKYGHFEFPNDGCSMANLGLTLTNLVLEQCNSLLKTPGLEVNLKYALRNFNSEDGYLILALLENTAYYKNQEDITFKGVYKNINGLEFYQNINSSDKSAKKYAQIGKFILDVLNNKETSILEQYEKTVQIKIYRTAKKIIKTMALKITKIYNEISKYNLRVALYGGASKKLIKYISKDFKDLFFTMSDNAVLEGACNMVLENMMQNLSQLEISNPPIWQHSLQYSNIRSPSIASSSSFTNSPSFAASNSSLSFSSSPSITSSPFANSPFAKRTRFLLNQ